MRLYLFVIVTLLACLQSAHGANLSCNEVLKQDSLSWINQQAMAGGGTNQAILEAISQYGACMDKRSETLRELSNESGKGPFMGALGNFRDFESALQIFKRRALLAVSTGKSYDKIHAAMADLYAKHFRYLFYSCYLTQKSKTIETEDTVKLMDESLRKILARLDNKQSAEVRAAFEKYRYEAIENNDFPEDVVYQYAVYVLQGQQDQFVGALF